MISLDNYQVLGADTSNLERFNNANKKTPENIEAVKKLSSEFEAIFLEIVLKSMRDTVQKADLMGGGNGEAIFQSMLDSEYSKNLATQAPTGLASSIQDHLLNLMGTSETAKNLEKAVGKSQYEKGQGSKDPR